MNRYATDGRCHNSEPGTFNHECGKLAQWLGTDSSGFQSGFCDDCKQHGYEARNKVTWKRLTLCESMSETQRRDVATLRSAAKRMSGFVEGATLKAREPEAFSILEAIYPDTLRYSHSAKEVEGIAWAIEHGMLDSAPLPHWFQSSTK
jgi:hypothetical protein